MMLECATNILQGLGDIDVLAINPQRSEASANWIKIL
jgi:hypothetical protein